MLLLSGFLLSTVIAGIALWRRSPSLSGTLGAVLVGTLTFGFGGLNWGLLMVVFFVTSSALSHFGKAQKQAALGRGATAEHTRMRRPIHRGKFEAVDHSVHGVVGNIQQNMNSELVQKPSRAPGGRRQAERHIN